MRLPTWYQSVCIQFPWENNLKCYSMIKVSLQFHVLVMMYYFTNCFRLLAIYHYTTQCGFSPTVQTALSFIYLSGVRWGINWKAILTLFKSIENKVPSILIHNWYIITERAFETRKYVLTVYDKYLNPTKSLSENFPWEIQLHIAWAHTWRSLSLTCQCFQSLWLKSFLIKGNDFEFQELIDISYKVSMKKISNWETQETIQKPQEETFSIYLFAAIAGTICSRDIYRPRKSRPKF